MKKGQTEKDVSPKHLETYEDHCRTDWKFDFSSLPLWDNRHSFSGIYDKFFQVDQNDTLCCIYSILEASMCNYVGFLAILRNKANPKLILNVTDGMNFCENFFADESGNYIFLQPSIYLSEINAVKRPILILDISRAKFTYYDTDNTNPNYRIVQLKEYLFGIKADQNQRKHDIRLKALERNKIDLRRLIWYDFSEISALPQMASESAIKSRYRFKKTT